MINSYVKFNVLLDRARLFLIVCLLSVLTLGLSACDSEPPALMKASKQFESDKIRDNHIAHMRKNHMDELMHKRDETVYNGIRTKKYSLNACISCHVPEKHNGEVLRHTNPEHFCSTCHGYVAAQLDCFDCHVDHPVSDVQSSAEAPNDSIHSVLALKANSAEKPAKAKITDESTVEKEVKGDSASE